LLDTPVGGSLTFARRYEMAQKVQENIRVDRAKDTLTRFTTASGIECKAFYGPDDLAGCDYARDMGDPGEYPYVRGPFPEMYRKFLWLKSINTSNESPASTNEKFRRQIAQGQTGMRFGVDVATCHGLDPDHPLARWDVGSNASPRWALCQLEEECEGIDLAEVNLESAIGSMWGNFCFYSMLIALFGKREIPLFKLRVSLINDPINNHGFDVFPSEPLEVAKKINTDIIEFSVKHAPLVHPFVPCGYDMGETGITAVQEMAFILANAIEYSKEAVCRGLNFDDFAPRIAFSIHGGISLFETVCKVRATRKIWAKIAKDTFNAQNKRSCLFRCGIRTAADNLTAQQPINNVPRITLQALAAALAGAQAIDACGFDDPFGIPSNEAETVSLNMHHIIGHESEVALVADPLGGSYFVEWLTNQMEKKIEKLLTEIEDLGGMYAALESGWVHRLWHKEALERQREVEEGRRVVVGVNRYTVPKEMEIPMPQHTFELTNVVEENIRKIEKLRRERSQSEVRAALLNLRATAEKDENVVWPAAEAFKAGATVKEVSGMVMEGMGFDYDFFNVVKRPAFFD